MMDLQAAEKLWTTVRGTLHHHATWENWPQTTWVAGGAAVIGLILAFWGVRVLRGGYVLVFMAAGAAVGKTVADRLQIDLLIGLVLGAGILGLIGYLFYRWWVGLTMGVIGALLVLVLFGAPQIEPAVQAFEDARLGTDTGRYDNVLSPPEMEGRESLSTYLAELWAYCWGEKRDTVYRTVGPAAVAGLLGLAVGVILPRLATILATSLIGVSALVIGGGYLVSLKWPQLWERVQAKPMWSMGLLAGFLLLALMYQASHSGRRPAPGEPVVPAPAA